jgi:hypothetical protein
VVWDLELEKSILDRDVWKYIGIGGAQRNTIEATLFCGRIVGLVAREAATRWVCVNQDAILLSSPPHLTPFRSRRRGGARSRGDKHQGHAAARRPRPSGAVTWRLAHDLAPSLISFSRGLVSDDGRPPLASPASA